jgi:hypothetical protein
MTMARTVPISSGFEQRTFECPPCGHVHKEFAIADPMKSQAIGWLFGELRRPV